MCRWPRWLHRQALSSPADTAWGLLSIGATQAAGFDALALHWGVVEERAAKFGQTVNRDTWRLVGLMHIAETREQAYRDVEYGIEQWFHYFQAVAAFPQMAVGEGHKVREMIDFVNESGLGSIGTVDDAVAQIERLSKQSNGGFGCYLLLAHEWANPRATHRSYELISQHVFPQFPGPGVEHAGGQGSSRGQPPGDGGRSPQGGGAGDGPLPGGPRGRLLSGRRSA